MFSFLFFSFPLVESHHLLSPNGASSKLTPMHVGVLGEGILWWLKGVDVFFAGHFGYMIARC